MRQVSGQILKRGMSILAAQDLLRNQAYVGGNWVAAASGNTFKVTNPANGTVVATVPDMDVADADAAVKAAAEAFKKWSTISAKERGYIVRQWYYYLESNVEHLAEIMTAESGKPIKEAKSEIFYGNSFVEWFSEEARRVRGEIIQTPLVSRKVMVVKNPIGVVALITPWNYPHAMITRKASAALAAGCTCVVKPSQDTPLTALAQAYLAEEAGIPRGVFNVITCDLPNAQAVGKFFCKHRQVAGLSFTGSTEVGRSLYKDCASTTKRLSLELGGNAPFIVFESAKLDRAAEGALFSKFRNCGQACIAANRFLVQEKVYENFVKTFTDRIKSSLKLGEGTQADVTTGPIINEDQLHKISDFVNDALSKGAKALIGGKPASTLGKLFYEPTVLVDIKENMRVYSEEVFGPVATIIKFKDEDEAVKIANMTEKGLAAYFFTEDISQMFRVSNALETGMIGINDGVISSAEAPFGGMQESGVGREGAHHGLDDYTYIKYMSIGNI